MGLREKVDNAGGVPASQKTPAQPRQAPLLDGEAKKVNGRIEPPPPPAESIPLVSISMEASSSAAEQQIAGPIDLSEDAVAKMAPAALLGAAVSELRSRKIADEDGFMDARDLRPLYRAVRDKGLIGEVFGKLNEAAGRAEALTREENVVRAKKPPPPPPPRRSVLPPAPTSKSFGSDRVTGMEATVASDEMPSLTRRDAQPAGAEALLPPEGLITRFLEELKTDVKPTTEQRYQKATEFHGKQLAILNQIFGSGDPAAVQRVILAHQQSAAAKRKKGEPPSRMERHILELARFSAFVEELEGHLREEGEFANLQAKKRSNVPGALQRIPSPDKEQPAPPQSVRPPVPSGKAGRLPSPERAQPAPEEAAKENGRKSEVPPEPETHKSRGRFARFMLSPVTWTAACVGGFTAAMLATHGFEELGAFINMQMGRIPLAAPYIRRVWETYLHLPPLETAAGAKALYFGLTALALPIGLYRKRKRVRKVVAELESAVQDEERFRKMRNYVVPILAKIYEDYSEGTFPKRLRTQLIEDSRFFLYMDELYRSPPKFAFIMKEAEVPARQVAKFHVPFGDAENEIIKIRLEDYVANINDPGLRQTYLRETYDRDPLFRKKLDEVFSMNAAGEYLYTKKQTDVAKALGNGEIEQGVPILKKLELDYIRLTERKEKR